MADCFEINFYYIVIKGGADCKRHKLEKLRDQEKRVAWYF